MPMSIVVDHHAEVVGRRAVGARDDQVVELGVLESHRGRAPGPRPRRRPSSGFLKRTTGVTPGARLAALAAAAVVARLLLARELLRRASRRAPPWCSSSGRPCPSSSIWPMHLAVAVEALRSGRTGPRRRRGRATPCRRGSPAPPPSVERSRSVSSTRRMNLPPWRRAYSQQNSAVRTPPMCSRPVGLGAKRVTTVIGGAHVTKSAAAPPCGGPTARLQGLRGPGVCLAGEPPIDFRTLESGRLAQLVERCFHTAEVTGSSPVPPTNQNKNLD